MCGRCNFSFDRSNWKCCDFSLENICSSLEYDASNLLRWFDVTLIGEILSKSFANNLQKYISQKI